MFMRRILPRNRCFVARACSRVKPLGSSLGRVLRCGWNVPAISGHYGSPADLCFPPSQVFLANRKSLNFWDPPPIWIDPTLKLAFDWERMFGDQGISYRTNQLTQHIIADYSRSNDKSGIIPHAIPYMNHHEPSWTIMNHHEPSWTMAV